MFAIRNLTRRAPQLSRILTNQQRTIVTTPPREKVSNTELLLHGAVLWLGIMGVPMYIAVNVQNYNAPSGAQ